jgi:hypothetical protein
MAKKSVKKTTTTTRKTTRRSPKKDNTMLYGIIFIIFLAIIVAILMMIKKPEQKIEALLSVKIDAAETKYGLTKEFVINNKKEDGTCDEVGCEYTVKYKLGEEEVAESVFYTSNKVEFNKDITKALKNELIKVDEFTGKDKAKYYLVTVYSKNFETEHSYFITNDKFQMSQGSLGYSDTAIKGEHDENTVWVDKNEVHYLSCSGKLGEYKVTLNKNEISEVEFVKFYDESKVEIIGECE